MDIQVSGIPQGCNVVMLHELDVYSYIDKDELDKLKADVKNKNKNN